MKLARRAILSALGAFAVPVAALAQGLPAKPTRIGFLWTSSAAGVAGYREAFGGGLRDLGYVEGRDVAVEHRYAEDRLDLLPGLAADVARSGVDVIVAQGTPAARAAKRATATIPIVMITDRMILPISASLST